MPKKKNNSFFYKNPRFTGFMVFAVIFIIAQSLTLQRYMLNLSETEKENTEELNSVIDQLQYNLNYALSTTNTLAFIVENYGVPRDYDSIAKKLLETNTLIDGLQLLQEGTITHMYPLEGNEEVIGYKVIEDPTRSKEVFMAAEKGQMYFAGPLELRQGGVGVVGRVPIRMENDSLAFAAVVIRLERLLEMSGISENSKRFLYQISKINPQTGEMEYFVNTDADFSESQVATVEIPMGQWTIYVKEQNPIYFKGIIQLGVLGLVLSMLAGFLTWTLVKRPAELEKRVHRQSITILENQRRFQALVENSLDAVAIIAPDGSNKYVSPSVKTVLGYSEEEIMNINLFEILHDEDKPFVAKEMQYVLQNPVKKILGHVSRIKHKDGTWRWIESSITNLLDDPAVNGIVDNFRDITDRKEAKDQLIKENRLSEAVINSLPGIFYLFDEEGNFLLWNKNLEKVTGYSKSEIYKLNPLSFFDGEEIEQVQEAIQEVFEKGKSFAEAHLVTKSGKRIYYLFTGSFINYNGKKCSAGTGIDISERREAELELKRNEEQLVSIFNNSISAVIMMDAEGLITHWNAKAEEIFGWTFEEVVNKHMHQFIIPDEHLDRHLQGMEHFRKTGKGPFINSSTEITAKRKDQEMIDVSLGVTTATIGGKEFFIGFVNDITDRKQIERIKAFEQRNRDALINSTKDLIWSVSKEMTLITANEAFKDSFKKYTGVSNVSKGDDMLPTKLDKDYTNFWKGMYDRAFKGETFTYVNVVPENENQEEQVIETNFNPIVIEGTIEGVACSARNITDRIKNQEEIKEYNEKLKTAQEIARLGYWEFNLTESELFWSDQVYEIWELDKNFKPSIENFFETVLPEDRQKFYLYTNKSIEDIDYQDIEYRIQTKSGKIKWIHQNGKKIINPKDDSVTFKGTLRDITENKLQQEEILDYIKKLQTAQKIAKLGYWEFDYKLDKLTWSDQVYEIWEIPKKKFNVTFQNFLNSIHPDDRERFAKEQEEGLSGKKPLEIEHRIVLKNGKIKWVLERGKLIKNEKGEHLLFEGTVQDITEQKQIELELREQNEFIKIAIDNLPVGIALRDIHTGKFTLMNKNFTQIYGWSQKEIPDADSFFVKVYPDADYRKKIKEQIFRDLASKDLNRMQWEGIHVTTKKGDKRIVSARNIPLYDQNLMISTVLDVTEKYLAEQQLALSNERYEYVTKATFDAIWDWDIQKNSIFWGEGFKANFGHQTEVVDVKFWFSNIHPEDSERIEKGIEEVLEGNKLNWEAEYRFMHKNGTYRYVRDRGIILRNVERKAIRFIGALQDITQQKEYEQKLLDVNQKLRNLSAYLQEAREEERISIAREIHDELGQQLTGIKLDASWLKNKIINHIPDDIERTERLIENINKAINDVRKVASNLRPGVLDDLGLEAAIEWQSQLFQSQTGIKCNLKTKNLSVKYTKEINTAVYRIYQEALTNVMRHANATELNTLLYEKNNALILEVIDNGKGIDESDKNNTFSLGITGMRERALMINAKFIIQNHSKGGTIVKLLVPLID